MLIYRKKLERLVKDFIEEKYPCFLTSSRKNLSPTVEALYDSAIVKNSCVYEFYLNYFGFNGTIILLTHCCI